jgi:hypothetical protein
MAGIRKKESLLTKLGNKKIALNIYELFFIINICIYNFLLGCEEVGGENNLNLGKKNRQPQGCR